MEKWEEKAIGRTERYADWGILSNLGYGTVNVLSGAGDILIRGGLGAAEKAVAATVQRNFDNKSFKGKYFKGGNKVVNWAVRKAGLAGNRKLFKVVDPDQKAKFLDYASKYTVNPTHKIVGTTVFNTSITFEAQKLADMKNACGYAPDFEKMITALNKELAPSTDFYTDVQWRKEVMPHLLKVTYQEELDKAFKDIQVRYSENNGLLSRGMMRITMRKAAQQLGEMFEDYSLKIANQTDYLEAPLTILPVKKLKEGDNFNPDEKRKWLEVARGSLFDSTKAIDKKIDAAMSPYKVTAERAKEVVENNLTGPIKSFGAEKKYVLGEDAIEDSNRYRSAVATVRDVKRIYEKRSFFGRWLTPSGHKLRNTIGQLSDKLTSFGHSKEEIASHLDLKSELGKEFDDASLFKLRQYNDASPFEVEKTGIVPTMGKAVGAITNLAQIGAEKTVDAVWRLSSSVGNYVAEKGAAAVNKTFSAVQSVFNYFSGGFTEVKTDAPEKDANVKSTVENEPKKEADTIVVDGVEYTEAMEDPDAEFVEAMVSETQKVIAQDDPKIDDEDEFEDAMEHHPEPERTEEKVTAQDDLQMDDEDEFEDALEHHPEPERTEEKVTAQDDPQMYDDDEFQEAIEYDDDEFEEAIEYDDAEFEDAMEASNSNFIEATTSETQKEPSTSYNADPIHKSAPEREQKPVEKFLQGVEGKEREAVKHMISAGQDDVAFYQGAAEFLYLKTIHGTVTPDFTQEKCDTLSQTFLTDAAIKNVVGTIQRSPAFRKAVVEQHLERKKTNEPFQADMNPNSISSEKLMKMYGSFISESSQDVKNPAQQEALMNKVPSVHKENAKTAQQESNVPIKKSVGPSL